MNMPNPFKRLPRFVGTSARRAAALAVCALPALGIGVHTETQDFVASFFYACSGSDAAPSVKIRYAGSQRLARRPESSSVELYARGVDPGRKYRVLGEVDVLAHSTQTHPDEFTERAKRAARQMGGDAIVDWWWDDAANMRPKAGDQGRLCYRGVVVRLE